jgi:hypothetical protein
MVVHTCYPSTQKAEAGGWSGDQSGDTPISKKVKLFLKKKIAHISEKKHSQEKTPGENICKTHI